MLLPLLSDSVSALCDTGLSPSLVPRLSPSLAGRAWERGLEGESLGTRLRGGEPGNEASCPLHCHASMLFNPIISALNKFQFPNNVRRPTECVLILMGGATCPGSTFRVHLRITSRRRIIRRLSRDQCSDTREQNLALDLVARGLRSLERIT